MKDLFIQVAKFLGINEEEILVIVEASAIRNWVSCPCMGEKVVMDDGQVFYPYSKRDILINNVEHAVLIKYVEKYDSKRREELRLKELSSPDIEVKGNVIIFKKPVQRQTDGMYDFVRIQGMTTWFSGKAELVLDKKGYNIGCILTVK